MSIDLEEIKGRYRGRIPPLERFRYGVSFYEEDEADSLIDISEVDQGEIKWIFVDHVMALLLDKEGSNLMRLIAFFLIGYEGQIEPESIVKNVGAALALSRWTSLYCENPDRCGEGIVYWPRWRLNWVVRGMNDVTNIESLLENFEIIFGKMGDSYAEPSKQIA